MESTEKYKCIIVDDEPIARKIIRSYIDQIAFLENEGEYKNAIEALEILSKDSSIQILFLDINMPNLSGLSLAKIINNNIQIIFTTAYSQYAVESYEVNAVDYLLKPFLFERFTTAVFKAIDRIAKTSIPSEITIEESKEEKIIYIKSEGISYPVNINEIYYCEAMKNYTKVFLTNGKFLKPLVPFSKMEQDLIKMNTNFLRVHRSFLISTEFITGIKSNSIMIGKNEIPIGFLFRDMFFKTIGMK